MSPSSSSPGSGRGAIGVAVAGLLIGLGGAAHPRVDTGLELEQGLAGMFESSMWTASHLLTMAGLAALAVSLAVLVSGQGPAVRVIGRLAAVAAGFAAVESLPHLLAASFAPLVDLHTTLQAVSTPALGLSLAALALAGAHSRTLYGGRVATVLAVLGGLAFALAGPAIAITEDPELSPLFAGSAGLAVWAVLAGAGTARRASRSTTGVISNVTPQAG